tara:strand:+ start:3512 stop:4204 length:693 start_codon:yes stop_codon:yes gene_type:complete
MSNWIKMRTNLLDDPRVGAISMRCDVSVTTTLGSLFVLWSIADQHSVDGVLPHMSEEWLDGRVGVPGFSEALRSVGWLEAPQDGSAGLCVPAFEEHNGASAKRRAMEAARKGRVRKVSASDADAEQTGCGTRAEPAKSKKRKASQQGEVVVEEGAGSAGRLVRAMALLSECEIAPRNKTEATRLLKAIAENRDPCTFMSDLIDRANSGVILKKGGWMLKAMREEAQCESP